MLYNSELVAHTKTFMCSQYGAAFLSPEDAVDCFPLVSRGRNDGRR